MTERRVVAQIPARAGSKRVPNKNLRRIEGRPLIHYAITSALNSKLIDRVIVNTDSREIADLALSEGVEVFHREPRLANDSATGDDFTFDFMTKLQTDVVALVNPDCPLIPPFEIDKAIGKFLADGASDTLISCSETQLPAAMNESFINIPNDKPLQPTQYNNRIQILNWAVAVWDSPSFIERYNKGGGAYIGDKRILHPIPAITSLKISEEADFELAAAIIRGLKTL